MEQSFCKFLRQSVLLYGFPSQKTESQMEIEAALARKLIAGGE